MGEDQGFLHAILTEPGDRTHCLVYADWLEERGDLRGEFLRAALELAAPLREGSATSAVRRQGAGHRARLRKRLRQLWRVVDAEWADLMDKVVRITASWRQIEQTLKQHVPEDFKKLARPATDAQIEKLQRAVGLPLPIDLLISLRLHNGMGYPASLVDGQTLLSASRIGEEFCRKKWMAERKDFVGLGGCPLTTSRKIKNDRRWNPAWVPITQDAGGDMYVLDLDPLPRGKVGQVFYYWVYYHSGREVLASSFTGWLEKIARQFARGNLNVQHSTIWLYLWQVIWRGER